MHNTATMYKFGTELNLLLEQAIERVTAALKEQGFGVLTTIDVRETLKQKLDVAFEPYTILGACNPHLAHRALQAEHDIGLLLPCNVVVHAHGDSTRVDIADPVAMLGIVGNQQVETIAHEVAERLHRVIAALADEA